MDDGTWVEQGQTIGTTNELREYIAAIRAEVHHMQTGLERAAWGVLKGRSWLDTPRDERFNHADVLREQLDMSVPRPGWPPRTPCTGSRSRLSSSPWTRLTAWPSPPGSPTLTPRTPTGRREPRPGLSRRLRR